MLAKGIEEKQKDICPIDNKKCMQSNSISQIGGILDSQVKEIEKINYKIKEHGRDMEIINDEVGRVSGAMTSLIELVNGVTKNVGDTTKNIDKLYRLHYKQEVDAVQGFSDIKSNISDIEKEMVDIRNESVVANMKQDFRITKEELDGYKQVDNDKRKLNLTLKEKFIATIAVGFATYLLGLWNLISEGLTEFIKRVF